MITASTLPSTAGERLRRYYAALPDCPDFHPAAHAARAARGLAIQARASSGASTARAGRKAGAPSNLRRPGSVPPVFFSEGFADVTDPRDPSAALAP